MVPMSWSFDVHCIGIGSDNIGRSSPKVFRWTTLPFGFPLAVVVEEKDIRFQGSC